MQDKKPLNDNGEPHGYWEVYQSNGSLWYKGEFINGQYHGLLTTYWNDGNPYSENNFVYGKLIGLRIWFNKNNSIKQTRFYAR